MHRMQFVHDPTFVVQHLAFAASEAFGEVVVSEGSSVAGIAATTEIGASEACEAYPETVAFGTGMQVADLAAMFPAARLVGSNI